jgi:acyl dehydratase
MNKPVPMYWEDFAEGDKFVTRARTVTETDIVMFAAMTGDYNPLHTDAEYAKSSIFGERIAHGLLGLAIGFGLAAGLGIAGGTAIAVLGLNWNFTGPIRIGDTIHVEQTVLEKRETKKPDRGIVVWNIDIVNQSGEMVQKGQSTLIVRRRPEG